MKIPLGTYDFILELRYLEYYAVITAELKLGVSSQRDSLEPIYGLELGLMVSDKIGFWDRNVLGVKIFSIDSFVLRMNEVSYQRYFVGSLDGTRDNMFGPCMGLTVGVTMNASDRYLIQNMTPRLCPVDQKWSN